MFVMTDDADDPFAVFGEEDDDHGENDNYMQETKAMQIAKSLVDSANARSDTLIHKPVATPNDTVTTPTIQGESIDTSKNICSIQQHIDSENELNLPWQQKPLFIGPIRFVAKLDQYGGGRGVVASHDLEAGTLILVEQPLLTWQLESQFRVDLAMVQNIIVHYNATDVVHSIEWFHPTKIAVDKYFPLGTVNTNDKIDAANTSDQDQIIETILSLDNQYGNVSDADDASNLEDLLKTAQEYGITNSDGSPFTKTDIFRIMIAIRYNGLESGIYLYSAMLNHSDQPNCVKFLPTTTKNNTTKNKKMHYSEVRTTRFVGRGDSLAISYIPKIVCHSTRRKYLWDQHRFDIGSEFLGNGVRNMELVDGNFPRSSILAYDEGCTTRRIEVTIAELTDMYKEALSDVEAAGVATIESDDSIEKCKSIEQTALELCTEAVHQLKNDCHLLLIPCLQLHLDSCYLVLRHSQLKPVHRTKLFERMIVTARRLIPLQQVFQGPDHFDLARTYLDLAQAIESLLAKSSQSLLVLYDDELDTVSAWATLEYRAKQEHNRIKNLYPRDADQFI